MVSRRYSNLIHFSAAAAAAVAAAAFLEALQEMELVGVLQEAGLVRVVQLPPALASVRCCQTNDAKVGFVMRHDGTVYIGFTVIDP